MIDSIIFDLDGTLWDSCEGVIKSYNEVLSNYKEVKELLTTEELKGCMGMVIQDIAAKLWPYINSERRMEIILACCENEVRYLGEHGGILYDDLLETLKYLSSKYKLFIVSNCQEGYIECFYKAHKLEKYFIDYENPGRTGLSKGENINLIIERNNLKSPVYVGDTEGDYRATLIAKVPFVFAKYGFGNVSSYDYVIEEFKDLRKIF